MKNVIKRIIVTILALILIFSFAACESEPFTCSICGDEKTGKYKVEDIELKLLD